MAEGKANPTDDFEIGEEEMVMFFLNKVFDEDVFLTKCNYL